MLEWARANAKDAGMEFLAVSVDNDWQTVDGWLKGAGGADGITLALDPQKKTAHAFGTELFPETYVIAPSGQVMLRVEGPMDWKDPAVQARLAEFRRAAGPLASPDERASDEAKRRKSP